MIAATTVVCFAVMIMTLPQGEALWLPPHRKISSPSTSSTVPIISSETSTSSFFHSSSPASSPVSSSSTSSSTCGAANVAHYAPTTREERVWTAPTDATTKRLLKNVVHLRHWGRQHNQERVKPRKFQLFCDLDGVLVDFAAGVRPLYNHDELASTTDDDFLASVFDIDRLHRGTMWKKIAAADAFFEHLPWTGEGRTLWEAIRPLRPDILTGVPAYYESRAEKFRWCQRELGLDINNDHNNNDHNQSSPGLVHIDKAGWGGIHAPVVRPLAARDQSRRHSSFRPQQEDRPCRVITCWSRNKHYESGPGHVLIDDRQSLQADWEAKGGIFILHRDTDSTLNKLYDHGILR